jgi:hypothetical protein
MLIFLPFQQGNRPAIIGIECHQRPAPKNIAVEDTPVFG